MAKSILCAGEATAGCITSAEYARPGSVSKGTQKRSKLHSPNFSAKAGSGVGGHGLGGRSGDDVAAASDDSSAVSALDRSLVAHVELSVSPVAR